MFLCKLYSEMYIFYSILIFNLNCFDDSSAFYIKALYNIL